MVGSLVEDNGTGLPFQLVQYPLPLFLIRPFRWKKGLKAEAPGRKSGHGQRCDAGRRARKGGHFNPRRSALAHEFLSGIGDSRCSRIRNQSDIHSFSELIHQIDSFLHLIILMVARHRGLYIKMIQKLDAVPGILRRYQIYFPERLEHAVCYILQISDRRRTKI